jgi:LPXTG-motif cell wall-anchored protein
MNMSKLTKILLSATAVVTLIGVTSSPALAVGGPVLPANDKLYLVECDSDFTELQLFSLNPESGVPTEIGEGAPGETFCGFQGAQQPGSDWFYFFNNASYLQRVDLITGVNETIAQFSLNESVYNSAYSLTFGPDGTAYVLSYDNLYTVNLETAELTYLSAPNFYDEYSGYPYAFAYDYVTEKFYVVEDGDGALYELTPSTGDKVELTYNEDYAVLSMAFDANGDLWINGEGDFVSKVALASFGNSDDWQDSPEIFVDSVGLYSESLWVSPVFATPELPDTGLSASALVGLGALLLLIGASIVSVRRLT